ncbi:MAG: murein biosynthesis integral membrane protein MurJ [Armatimonadota bacterium]
MQATTNASLKRHVAGATGFLALSAFLSRALGYVRDAIISGKFGMTGQSDAYIQSFFIPDLLYQLLAGGALAAAFIPVFTNYLATGKEEDAWKVFSVVATILLPVVTFFVIAAEMLAVPLSYIAAPGFTQAQLLLVARLTRIVLPAQICFFMGGLLMGVQNAHGRFFGQAVGPLIYNIGIIVGGLLLSNSVGIAGFSWGALVGALVGNLLLQIFLVKRLGVKYRPSLDIRHPGVVKVGKLLLPVVLGLSLPQLAVRINRVFVSMLGEGRVLALNNADRVTQAPLGVFAQSAGIALLPTLSAQAAVGDMNAFKSSVSLGVRSIVALTLPTSVFMAVLAVPIIRVMYQHGRFTAADTYVTAVALAFYSVGIVGWAAQAVIARAFYALHDTITPVLTGTVMTVLLLASNWMLANALEPGGWSHGWIAFTSSVAAVLQAVILLAILRKRIGGVEGRLLAASFAKVGLGCCVLALLSMLTYQQLTKFWPFPGVHSALHTLLRVLASMLIGSVAYGYTIKWLRLDEARYVWSIFAGPFARRIRKSSARP